ncbi:hypothetical protein ACTG9Q_24605 [Actinokineospora sp. 24-640]
MRIERQRGANAAQVADRLRGRGGRLLERRVDGSVTELVMGADDDR